MEGKKKEEKRIACARVCVCVCSDSNRYYLLFYSNETLAGSLCLPTSSLNPSLPRRVRWPHEYPDGLSRRTLDTRERFELDEASIYFRYFVFAAESGIFDSIQFRLIKRTRFIFTGPLFASEKERIEFDLDDDLKAVSLSREIELFRRNTKLFRIYSFIIGNFKLVQSVLEINSHSWGKWRCSIFIDSCTLARGEFENKNLR